MIAQNICHAAVLAGHSVLFRSAPALLEELHRQTPEGRRRKLRTYANVGLLVRRRGRVSVLRRQGRRLALRSHQPPLRTQAGDRHDQQPFKEWNEVFPNATCIVTLLDRLLHHADVTVIEGDSYRVRESEQETAARRRKK